MTTVKNVKYKNDYTNEFFDTKEECIKSEREYLFSMKYTGIVVVFDDGKTGDITEVFDEKAINGLDVDRINAIIFPTAKTAREFVKNFKNYWASFDGSYPILFDYGICDDNEPDTLTFVPSIKTDDEDDYPFICMEKVKMIIHNFQQDLKLAENARKMLDKKADM